MKKDESSVRQSEVSSLIIIFQLSAFSFSAFSVLPMPAPTTLLITLDCPDRIGRDCEKLALARGVLFHIQDRIVVPGLRAFVFRD